MTRAKRNTQSTLEYFVADLNEPDELEKVARLLKDDAMRDAMDELIVERKRLNLTQSDIAEATNMKASNIARIESPNYAPSINILERYALAVGKTITLHIEDIPKASQHDATRS